MSELRDLFVAGVAHDLRGPLQSICMELETALQKELPESAREGLETALHTSRRLCDAFEDLVHLEGGMTPRKLNLADSVGAAAAEEHVEAVFPAVMPAHADPGAALRIVRNIVHNVVLHGKPPLLVEAVGGGWRFRDQGNGLPEGILEALRDGTPIPRRGSHGLGLELVRATARAQGGDLLESHGHPLLVLPTPSLK